MTAQRVFAWSMVGLSIVLLYTGLRFFFAGINDYQAMLFQANCERSGKPPQHKAWLVARDASERANGWHPFVDNGIYLERLGRIHDWQYAHMEFATPIASISRDRSV